MASRRGSAGGAAAAGGMNFQYRVTAWVAVEILAEKGASSPWSLPEGTALEWLRCETEQPVDDLLVGTSGGGFVFSQIKHTLRLSKAADSDLASVLDQFVRQFIANRAGSSKGRPWERPLDPLRDRLVLITGPRSSKPIRVHVPAILGRVRNLVQGQLLEDSAVNDAECETLSIVVGHVRRSWQAALGVSPSDDEVRQLLSLIHIQVLDVDGGGDAERGAKDRLRALVLHDPGQADMAWALLVGSCGKFAEERSGADRPQLQRALLAQVEIQAAHSYRDDIERLKTYSWTTADFLADLARIRGDKDEIKIKRRSTEELRRVAEEGSILVVGEPGAGKSGALHDLVQMLKDGDRDVVFLAVDRLAAHSLGELREELGLDRNLTEVLANWPGREPAFLVVDALDAARADPAARAIRDLIRDVVKGNNRWRVVASIRKFDLRYGQELRQLFLGEPPTEFRDPQEFTNIRHLNIPQLSNEELAQIPPQSPALQELIDKAQKELHELLRVPFNLRLMAELLGVGVDPTSLTPIRTQLELLDRYWSHRVIRSDRQGDARETILRRVCEEMVNARALRVDRSRVVEPTSSATLNDLLSAHVLAEWQPSPTAAPDRYVLTFSHHVLFDYAVARLLLRGTSAALVVRLADDPELVLVVRPSLVLHFRHLWAVDCSHERFWDLVLQIVRESGIPEIGKLIGPSVGAELANELSDLEPLCVAIESTNPATRTTAEQVLRYVVGSLLAASPSEPPLVGPGAGPWCDLLERVSRNLRPQVAYTIGSLLSAFCEHPETFTPEQRVAAGKTTRRLLEFAWARTPRDQWLVIRGLQTVCRTFESEPAASATLLHRSFEPEHFAELKSEEMPWLAREVRRLIPIDTAFVEEIYRVAFAHRELSREPTPIIGQSRILPLTSNPQQDYGMALYELAEVFPEFLAHTPKRATSTLVAVMKAYITHHHSPASGEIIEESFDFDGQEARICTDYSAIWDAGSTSRHDEPLKMLDSFERYMERLAEREENLEELRQLIGILVAENRLAVLWRRLLVLGTRFPSTLGREILPLAWAMPVLTGFDTGDLAGEFLRGIFPELAVTERERIEQAVLSIPDTFPLADHELGERTRNRLLGCLVQTDVVTDGARRLLADLHATNAVPSNEPPVRFEGGSYSEEESIGGREETVEAEANRKIRDLERPVKEFANKHLNSVPTQEEMTAILSALQALRSALFCADAEGVHPKQHDYAWGYLAAACGRIARGQGLWCEDAVGTFVRGVLLEASHHAEPTPQPEHDAGFDERPSWGSPAARIEAAEGLISLASHPTCASAEVLQAIERLIIDPARAVRFQIASRLNTLYQTTPELMWSLVERLCREEPSRGVLQGLLSGVLDRLAGAHPDQVASLTKQIFDRASEGPGAKQVRELCVSIFTQLYIWRDHAMCREIVWEIAVNPAANPDEALHVLQHLRKPLTHGPVYPSDPNQDAIRRRAFDLLVCLLRSAGEGLRHIEAAHVGEPFNVWPEAEQKKAQSLVRLIDDIGRQVYFASGAFDSRRQGRTDGERSLTPEERERFYREAGLIFDELADVGLPSLAHHLLETLEAFIPLDPCGVFLWIGRVVQGGRKGGYQYESMAADLMVRLVERYLAEYRVLLRENEECRRILLEVLDIFVQAGWPSAQRLTYRLEEIFR